MKKLIAVTALLCASTGMLAGSANGESLRALINHRIEENMLAEKKKKGGSNSATDGLICKSDTKKQDDRTCEPPTGAAKELAARCDECVQECHVWGDPHLKPYSNGCSVNVFHAASNKDDALGWYNYLEVPGLKVELWVQKIKSKGHKPYVFKVRVNGKVQMDVAEYGSFQECGKAEGKWLYHDLKSDNKESVRSELFINCRDKGNVKQLEVLSRMIDQAATPSVKTSDRRASSSDALNYWATAKGGCVDWVTYGVLPTPSESQTTAKAKDKTEFNCKGTSKLATVSGRKCVCAAECAAWGDPHVKDFKRKNANKAKNTFVMPKAADMQPHDRVMYTFQDRFATFIEVDECEFIVSAEVWMLKPGAASKYSACNPRAGDSGFIKEKDYEIVRVKAEDVCQGSGTTNPTRTVIQIPDPSNPDYGSDLYDDEAGGYPLGRQAYLSSGVLTPIDGDFDDEPTDAQQCVKDQGHDAKADFEVNMGGVEVYLKCHIRPDGHVYFNICNNRGNMIQQTFSDAAAGSDVGSQAIETFMNVEKAGRSGGWCATGDVLSAGASIASSAYEQRGVGEAGGFKFTDSNTQ